MRPGQLAAGAVFVSGVAVVQKLAAIKMAIRAEADSQKAVAIDAHMDESQLARKLADKEALTFRDLDRFPEEVQRAALLEMLTQMGLPARVQRYLPVIRALEGAAKKRA